MPLELIKAPFRSRNISKLTPYLVAKSFATLAESLILTPTKCTLSPYCSAALAKTGSSRRQGSHVEYQILMIVGVPRNESVETVVPSTLISSTFANCKPVLSLLVAISLLKAALSLVKLYVCVASRLSHRPRTDTEIKINTTLAILINKRVLAGTRAG